MTDRVLVLNTGSSSIKFGVYAAAAGMPGERLLGGQMAGIGGQARLFVKDASGDLLVNGQALGAGTASTSTHALDALLDWLDAHPEGRSITAVGHRVVHGGTWYDEPVRIDAEVIARLRSLVPVARLHQPFEVDAIAELDRRRPGIVQIACFDTAVHRTQPAIAQLYALPRASTEKGVRRYGFHGLSYDYIAGRLPGLIGGADQARVVVAHLGSGSSMCAMQGGRSIATTMGFTALEGLVMGTRSGSIDPGIVLYFLQECGMSVQEVDDMLYRRSGLLGVSGLSSDMRILLASDDPHAREAVEVYVYQIVRQAGALIACLGGLDAFVFTAGIGEHASPVRASVCKGLSWLGIDLDPEANARGTLRISRDASAVSAWVIPTDEESVIARAVARLVA